MNPNAFNAGLLAALLVILKLTGQIDWPWWATLAPTWIWFVFAVTVILCTLCIDIGENARRAFVMWRRKRKHRENSFADDLQALQRFNEVLQSKYALGTPEWHKFETFDDWIFERIVQLGE